MPLNDELAAVDETEKAEEKAPRRAKNKKPKKEKPPKQKKTKGTEKQKKEKKEKKPLTAGKAALFTALVFLLLIGGAAGAVVMDVGGTREALATMLHQGETEEAKSGKELELMAKDKEQAEKDKELAEREKTVDSQQTSLDKREKELDAREELLLQTEQDTVGSQESLTQLAEVYSRMEPASAAQILSQIKNKQDITDILMQMKQNKVADILSAMTPELASEITLLMKQNTAAATATPTPTPTTTG